jgi:hypothetical protein
LAHRNLDDLVTDTEHARPVHPFRALIENHCYLEAFVDLKQNGMSLLLMDGLILVPVIMFGFFYPRQVLLTVGAILLVVGAIYEGVVIWRKRHPAQS